MRNYEAIELAKQVLQNSGYLLVNAWHVDDIKSRAKQNKQKLTKEDLKKVVEFIENNHDANSGMNWDFIDYAINEVLEG
jgi:hypothetical protein